MSTHGLCLSAAASGAFRSGDKPGVYRKDFAKPGEWLVPRLGLYLSITPERMGMWAKTFQLMRDRGVSVPLTVDHIEVRDEKGNLVASEVNAAKAAARVGSVINLLANGDFEAQPADAEAEKIMLRNPEVSLELDFDFVDGHGNVYDEAITAITLTPKDRQINNCRIRLSGEMRSVGAG